MIMYRILEMVIPYRPIPSMGLFDISRKVFLSPNCVSDQVIKKYVMKVLEEHKIPEANIFDDSEMNLVSTGDYLIRCISGTLVVHKIDLSLDGFVTKIVGRI